MLKVNGILDEKNSGKLDFSYLEELVTEGQTLSSKNVELIPTKRRLAKFISTIKKKKNQRPRPQSLHVVHKIVDNVNKNYQNI